MKVTALTIKLFGKKETVWRVLDAAGEVVHVAASEADASAWLAAQ